MLRPENAIKEGRILSSHQEGNHLRRTSFKMKAVLACVFLVLLAVTKIQGRAKPHLIGCYKDNNEPSDTIPGLVIRDLSEAELTLDDSMTVNRCARRCYRKGYYYAGLQNGDTCRCGRIYGLYGEGGTCDMKCSGNKRQKCGGASSNSIYTTGLADPYA